jgi:DNA-binding Lrp family transcriptional regulator
MKLFFKKNIIIENYNLTPASEKIDELDEAANSLDTTITQDLKIPKEVLDSFQLKPSLNPEFWDREILRSDIRDQLMLIAQDFFDGLNSPENLVIKDVIFTGSLANYNWSKFSDVDMHVIVDFETIEAKEEFVKQLFDSYKNLWNKNHDITIKGYNVELYLQDIKETLSANAVYSVKRNKWLLKPEKEKFKINRNIIKKKALGFFTKLKDIKQIYADGDYQKALDKSQDLKDKIKKYRKSGLESGGEFSLENLVFKVLRRTPYMEVLNDINSKSYDQIMSIQENT